MKRVFVLSIAVAAICAAPALAQSPSPFNWSGFYIGLNGGGLGFTTDGNFPFVPTTPSWHTSRKEVGVGGVHGGLQGQWGNFVAGIEGGFEKPFSSSFADTAGGAGQACGYNVAFTDCQAKIKDILTVGPRLGVAMNQWLLYGTGGYARGTIESRALHTNTGIVIDDASNHHGGWYAGGGVDFMVSEHFLLGVEYKHYDFRTALHNCCVFAFNEARNLNAKADAVLARMTIKQ